LCRRHGLHHIGHGHFRGNVWIVDPGWYGSDGSYAPYADDSAYNPHGDPNSEYYDPDYCDSSGRLAGADIASSLARAGEEIAEITRYRPTRGAMKGTAEPPSKAGACPGAPRLRR
jgi:hypothetical protein